MNKTIAATIALLFIVTLAIPFNSSAETTNINGTDFTCYKPYLDGSITTNSTNFDIINLDEYTIEFLVNTPNPSGLEDIVTINSGWSAYGTLMLRITHNAGLERMELNLARSNTAPNQKTGMLINTDEGTAPHGEFFRFSLVVNWSSLEAHIYINGELAAMQPSGGYTNPVDLLTTQPTAYTYAATTISASLNHQVADLRIWHTARTQAEIQNNLTNYVTSPDLALNYVTFTENFNNGEYPTDPEEPEEEDTPPLVIDPPFDIGEIGNTPINTDQIYLIAIGTIAAALALAAYIYRHPALIILAIAAAAYMALKIMGGM